MLQVSQGFLLYQILLFVYLLFIGIRGSFFFYISINYLDFSFAVKKSMLWFWQSNMTILNSTFENISCNYLIYFTTNTDSVNSFTLQNIKMERNNFITSALYSTGGIINLTVDSLKFNQNNIWNDVGLLIMGFSGGNMLFLNTMLFINNYVGKFYHKFVRFISYI